MSHDDAENVVTKDDDEIVEPEFPKNDLETVAPDKDSHDRAIEEVEKLDLEEGDEEEEEEEVLGEESEIERLRAQVKQLLAEREVEEEEMEEEEGEAIEAESEEEEEEEEVVESEEEEAEPEEVEKPKPKPKKKKKKTWHKPTIVPSLEKKGCECQETADPCECAEEKKEEEEDVGGAPTHPLFLDPCPACGDGIQNCGETGIDCGGPCAQCAPPPVKKLPKGASVIDALWIGETEQDRTQELAQLGKKYKPSSGHASIQYRRTDPQGNDATVNVTYGIGNKKGD